MVYFQTPYYTPMDRAYHGNLENVDSRSAALEEPIFPISSIGMTVPDIDPSGRYRNILESVDASFKAGAGNIQLVMMAGGRGGGMGGGPKAYGEEIREAIRDIQKASGAKITGVELPNHITNVSGFDPRQGFSEEQRKNVLDEVRDSIKFVGDIAGGGNVNVISWEFPRNFSDASWWNDEKGKFRQEAEQQAMLVDKETGKVIPVNKKEKFYLYNDPNDPNFRATKEPMEFTWDKLQQLAGQKGKLPEQYWVEQHFENQHKKLQGEKGYYGQLLHQTEKELKEMEKLKDEKPEDFRSQVGDEYLKALKDRETGFKESLNAIGIQEKELRRATNDQYVPIKDFGVNKSADSYAQAGIWAMEESQKNQFVKQGKGSVAVGPELSWPQYYGSHPTEWVELIRKSRDEMARKLTDSSSSYYDSSLSKEQAKDLAKDHIKGELDTAHLGMWLQNFKPELPWDKRVGEFKKWFKSQIEYISDINKTEDILGSVQVVDTATGQHAHLPPGEGVLGKDVFEYMKILKEKGGYKGDLTSEGHEEEQYGQGRILTKAWETLGSPIGTGYWHGQAMPQFATTRNQYASRAYGTTGIYQSYVPSNDFTLWSQVPFE